LLPKIAQKSLEDLLVIEKLLEDPELADLEYIDASSF